MESTASFCIAEAESGSGLGLGLGTVHYVSIVFYCTACTCQQPLFPCCDEI